VKDLPRVTIYTDGACDPNPGPGGWAALLQFGDYEKTLEGFEAPTTNNRMELTAALRALQALKQPCDVDLFTDSEYLKRGITEWMPEWRRRQWRRKGGELANTDLWQALDEISTQQQITWHWVRGHAGNMNNQRVDILARKVARQGT
jgi:ribonuclease HI